MAAASPGAMERLRGKYPGARIAVIGSAPSATAFAHDEEVAIGVNGAARLLHPGEYFLSADQRAHLRSWFTELTDNPSILRGISAIYSDRFYHDAAQRAELQDAYERWLDRHADATVTLADGFRFVSDSQHPRLNDAFARTIPAPDANHIMRYFGTDEPLSPTQQRINVGGTSACCAVQVAFLMGARSIHLYGVEFTNEVAAPESHADYTGGNYFYAPEAGETGKTTPAQRRFLDAIVAELHGRGVPVYSHGPTMLENTIVR